MADKASNMESNNSRNQSDTAKLQPLSLDMIKPHVSFPYNIVNKKGEIIIKAGAFVTMGNMEKTQIEEDIFYILPSKKITLDQTKSKQIDLSKIQEGAIYPFALLDEQGHILLEKETRVNASFLYGYKFLKQIHYMYEFESLDLSNYSLNPINYQSIEASNSYTFSITDEQGNIIFAKNKIISDGRKLAFDYIDNFFLAISNQIKIGSDSGLWNVSAHSFNSGNTIPMDSADMHGNLIFAKGRHLSDEDFATLKLLQKIKIKLTQANVDSFPWNSAQKSFFQKLLEGCSNPALKSLQLFKQINHSLLEQIREKYYQNTEKLMNDLLEKDQGIYQHSINLALFSLLLILQLKNDLGFQYQDETVFEKKAADFFLGALLHDIGMLKIKTNILQKNSKDMTKDEKLEYSSHPQRGYEMLQNHEKKQNLTLDQEKNDPVQYSDITKQCLLFHHERYDDKGYPTRLPYDGLPSSPKWIGILEIFDTLIQNSRRPAQDINRISDALKGLVNASDTLLDLNMVTLFVNKLAMHFMHGIPFYNKGDYVVIEGNDLCSIENPSANFPLSPRVQILYNGYGKKVNRITVVDLRKDTRKIKKFLSPERIGKYIEQLEQKQYIQNS